MSISFAVVLQLQSDDMWNLQLVELRTLLGSKTEKRAVSSQNGNWEGIGISTIINSIGEKCETYYGSIVVVEQLGIAILDLVDFIEVLLIGEDLIGSISHDCDRGKVGRQRHLCTFGVNLQVDLEILLVTESFLAQSATFFPARLWPDLHLS